MLKIKQVLIMGKLKWFIKKGIKGCVISTQKWFMKIKKIIINYLNKKKYIIFFFFSIILYIFFFYLNKNSCESMIINDLYVGIENKDYYFNRINDLDISQKIDLHWKIKDWYIYAKEIKKNDIICKIMQITSENKNFKINKWPMKIMPENEIFKFIKIKKTPIKIFYGEASDLKVLEKAIEKSIKKLD